jgi:hypothetical protein
MRLCSITRQLASPSPSPVELSNEGHEDADGPCTWNVLFNIPIPGWLPASSTFGDEAFGGSAGVSYALYATAKFATVEDGTTSKSWFSLSSLCSAFSSRTVTAHAPSFPITLTRFAPAPPHVEEKAASSVFPPALYQTTTQAGNDTEPRGSDRIPLGVLEKIKVFIRVPEHIALGEDTEVPLALRMQADALNDDESTRLRVTGFSTDVEQIERYRLAAFFLSCHYSEN